MQLLYCLCHVNAQDVKELEFPKIHLRYYKQFLQGDKNVRTLHFPSNIRYWVAFSLLRIS